MSRKVGRPTESLKSIKLQIRVDDKTLRKLDEYATELETTRSDVVRKGIDLVGKQLEKK